MELVLTSLKFDAVSTEGQLLVDDHVFSCYTLELPYTDGSVGTAIPAGRFPVVLSPSPKFEKSTDPWVQKYANRMPHVVDIPGRSLIMIHWGNSAVDTDGCVLVGETQGQDFIGSSRAAFAQLYAFIAQEASVGNCWLTVRRDRIPGGP
jgi:Family of unknown function (DUF5675)